ncbi:nicotinate-nucleotide adenylyltransferase [Tranquillimonas rosea]|uniref:Probable nicotinate-nucleotide adenylyltransferase n=1 Tax=Tranquillimonas rosea TaxID=641238 RepID=A0A1H9RE27_9RHOB|nr:nicotinate-nucleotide adenylyltransferase [Tranquillimonas rosea]SER71141.1 nicotinate-nucleotide adenylyltransferase [Tranquillimonas rosea]
MTNDETGRRERRPGPGWPTAARGQAVGLLGGSFDPAHDGHAHITREAMKRFGLDRVWWLMSPGNPLKSEGPAPLDRRMAQARSVMDHPFVHVTALEARLGTRYTADTLDALRQAYPGVRFVWLMGADNLTSFHLWGKWQWIIETVPVGVLARPGLRLPARASVAARRFAAGRVPARLSRSLPWRTPPAWCFVNVPMVDLSSSDIRAQGRWGR